MRVLYSTNQGSVRQDRFTQAQIINIIKEQESGLTVLAICRKHSIGDSNFYRWKAKYGGMNASEAQQLKHLEQEKQKLKRLVADLSLDKVRLEEVLAKKA